MKMLTTVADLRRFSRGGVTLGTRRALRGSGLTVEFYAFVS